MADSPLSDADSLSSAGASTEPLPGSDPAPISPVKRTSGPPRRNPGGKGGNESDSSLTEQDSSDNDVDRDDDDDDDEQPRDDPRGGVLDDDEDEDDEDEDMQPTPRAKASQKRRTIDEDEDDQIEEDDEDEEVVHRGPRENGAGQQARAAKDQVDAVMRAVEGHAGTDNEVDELSEASEDERDRTLSGQPPTKRLRRGGGPSLNGSIISSSTANGHFSRANSPTDSLSGSEDEVEAATGRRLAADHEQQIEDAKSDVDDSDAPVLKKVSASGRGRGRGGATRARGGRGGGVKRGALARGGSNAQTRHRSLSPSARSESPLSVVSSSDGAALKNAVKELEDAPSGNSEEGDKPDEFIYTGKGKPGKPALDYATGRSARGRGRGRARYRPPRKSRGGLSAPSVSRSDSNRSSSGTPDHHDDLPLVNGNSSQAPDLPEPSGLVELDTSEPARLADQLHEVAAAEALPLDSAATGRIVGAVDDRSDSQGQALDKGDESSATEQVDESASAQIKNSLVELEKGKSLVHDHSKESALKEEAEKEKVQEEEETDRKKEAEKEKDKEREKEKSKEKEGKREPVKRVAPASAKKGPKKGGKKGKGKEKAVDQDTLAAEDDEPNDSDREEDTSDAAFMRKRSDAMEHLTKIEIHFAKLRDMLYVERMTEIEKDRIAIETGTHPELIHLTQLLELRRNKRLELAKAWLDGLESSYDRQYFSDEHAMWNHWQNKRAELRTEMLDEANSKRRRLDREKRALERPKDDTLASILAPRAPPAVPLHHRRRLGFDGEALVENEIAWALRNPDVRADPSLSSLDDADAYADLERMGLREPIGHPAMFPYDTIYGNAPGHMSAFSDPRTAHLAPGYPYGAFDPVAMSMQAHPYAAVAGAASAPFASLPPLPGREQPPSRPSSNPRHPNYPLDAPGPHAHGFNGASNRIYPYSAYPDSMTAEPMHAQHGSWPVKTALGAAYGFEEERRRTLSAGGNLGAAESLDSVAGSRQNGADDPMSGSRPSENGGRTTPVGGTNPKPRLTLDDHMSHRSPKAPTSTAKATDRAASGRSSPASFMAIPTIPPFDRHRHEMAIAAARANSPHPPPPPAHSKPNQPSLYPHASTASEQQQGQYHTATSTAAPTSQRANFIQ